MGDGVAGFGAEVPAEVSTPEAVAMMAMLEAGFEMLDDEDVAPSDGLEISTLEFSSEPDGNTVKILFIRPESETPLPLVYDIHGGGMQTMSAFNGLYRSRGRRSPPTDDVRGLPPTVISVNECDPLRNERVDFYRLHLRAGVEGARCRQVMGTIHGTEIFAIACPDISWNTAADVAAFCTDI